MRKFRSLLLLCLVAGALVAPAAEAQPPPPEVPPLVIGGSPASPGATVTVAGEGCRGASTAPATVMVGLLDAEAEGLLASTAVAAAADGRWSASLAVPASTSPGTYPVTARCTDYAGYDGPETGPGAYDGYAGYDGSGSFDYPRGQVVVLPPAAPPESDGELTVTPDVVARGTTATVSGGGWNADEQVTVAMWSDPIVLAATRTDAEGAIRTEVRIPATAALGEHTVCAMNASAPSTNPARNLCAQVTVVDAVATPAPTPTEVGGISDTRGSLAFTGHDPWLIVLFGLLLLFVGTEMYRRFRRPVTVSS